MTALYQPGHGRFTVSDEEALAALRTLAAAAPCTLVSHGPDGFRVTLLPMLVHPEPGGGLVLRGHVARGNVQWRDAAGGVPAVAIAHGPQAYVHPGRDPRRTRIVITRSDGPAFHVIGENIHCSRVVKKDGVRMGALPDGRPAVRVPTPDGERLLPVPDAVIDTNDFRQGRVKHVMVAVRHGLDAPSTPTSPPPTCAGWPTARSRVVPTGSTSTWTRSTTRSSHGATRWRGSPASWAPMRAPRSRSIPPTPP